MIKIDTQTCCGPAPVRSHWSQLDCFYNWSPLGFCSDSPPCIDDHYRSYVDPLHVFGGVHCDDCLHFVHGRLRSCPPLAVSILGCSFLVPHQTFQDCQEHPASQPNQKILSVRDSISRNLCLLPVYFQIMQISDLYKCTN